MGVLDSVKKVYFALEDKYYELLDGVQKKIPVYSVVDPIDKIVPSFGVLLALVFLLVGSGLFFVAGGISFAPENVTLSLSFNNESGAPVEGILVSVNLSGDATSPSPDLVFPISKTTSAQGKVTFSLPPGLYVVQVEDDSFDAFSQEIELKESSSKIFSLKASAPQNVSRSLLIQDSSGSILGIVSPVEILLSFSCQSGAPPLSQKVYSGNVSIQQPANCAGMSVTVTANGFITKTQVVLGDTTIISMQSSADFDDGDDPIPTPVSGTVEVFSKAANNAGVSGVQVKLYKVPPAGSNILADQSLSDTSGFSLFEGVSPGKYVVVASKQGYKQTTSTEFSVIAGETNTINLSLPVSSTKKKLFVKVLKQADQTILPGSTVALFVQAVGGKYLEYDSYTVDANGFVNKELADFNGNTMLVVQRANFITQFLPNTGIFSGDDATPLPILLESTGAANANGSIPNGVVADVKVVDEINFPVYEAQTYLYYPDLNGVLVGAKKTNAQGIARYTDLPEGTYQASASTKDFDGSSPSVAGTKAKIITLQVPLQVGSALVEVTVKTEQNQIIADANVSIIKLSNDAVQAKASTNAQGVAQLGVLSDQTVYVKVEKPGYLPFSSVPFDILKDNTHKIAIEVSLTSASPNVDMALTSIYQISDSGTQSLAQSIAYGGLYAFHFSVKTPSNASGLKGVVRLNGTTPSLLSSDIGQIVGAQVSKGGTSFYTTFTPSDEFAPKNAVNSGTPAKIALNDVGDVNGGAYEFIVLVKIIANTPSSNATLKINYQSKSGTQKSALYEANYKIGDPIKDQQDYLYLFFLKKEGISEETVQISSGLPATPGTPAIIEANKNYTLSFQLTNVSGVDAPNAAVTFSGTDNAFTIVPTTVSFSVSSNKSVSGDVTLKSLEPCNGAQPSCDTVTVTLSGGANGKVPTSQVIKFFTVPEKQVTLNVSPAFLLPDKANQVVQAVGLDNFDVPLTSAQGLLIEGQLKTSAGVDIGDSIPFTSSGGSFIAAIPSAPEGSVLEITASASGYLPGFKSIPVSQSSVYSLSQDFSCVTITPGSTPFSLVQGTFGSLKVETLNCGESISIYTDGVGSISVPVKNGSSSVNEVNPVTLGKNDSITLTATAPFLIGMYPIKVHAKFASQSAYSLLDTLDLLVKPVSVGEQCLSLSSYVFDLTQSGSATSVLVNNCDPLVKDAMLPSASLDHPDVYTHAVPPILTPQLQSPGSEVSFEWQVEVDYNFTNNPDLNISDYEFTALSDGNWTRYVIMDGSKFLDTKEDFAGAESMIVPDARNFSGGLVLIESEDKSKFPHANNNPKSLLFETTLMVRSAVELDKMCFETGGLNDIRVLLDGVEVQTNKDGDCSSVPNALKNVKLAPGPHSIQVFIWDKEKGNYWISFAYNDSQLLSGWQPLSKNFTTTGLRTNAQTNLPFSSLHEGASFTNKVYKYPDVDPAQNTVVPSQHASVPKYLGTLTGAVADILSNKSGIDHLKVAYPRFYSSDPQVRIFLKGMDVYAQFVGYDDPVSDSQKKQYVVVEDKDLVGTEYGIMRLLDYSTNKPFQSELDVGVLVDASSSVLGEAFSLTSGSGVNAVGKQNGICAILQNMEQGIEYYTGANAQLKVFWLNVPVEYKKFSITPPCAGLGLNTETLVVTDMLDSNTEFWARGAEVLANHSFWKNDTSHLMLVITDNKPLGTGIHSSPDSWGGSEQEEAVEKAIDAMNNHSIRGAVLYVTPIESTSMANFDSEKLDSIEMYDAFSRGTSADEEGNPGQGLVEALEFPPFQSIALGNNPLAWEQSGHNKQIQRLAQHAFPLVYQDVVVKLVSHPLDACIGENGEVGSTGFSAAPKIKYSWGWNEIDMDTCDRKTNDPSDYIYCDGLQFLTSLTKKLQALRETYDAAELDPATPLLGQVPSLTQFDAYLIRDHFNHPMRNDFVTWGVSNSFADFPDYFKSDLAGGAWKDYFDSPSNLSFKVNGDANLALLPVSGLYRVSITYPSTTFFTFSEPSSDITVSLQLLSPASSLPGYSDLYEIPIDGRLGFDQDTLTYKRDGYGTAFTGYSEAVIAKPGTGSGYFVKTYPNAPGFTALNTYHVNTPPSFVELNAGSDRGVILEIDRLAKTFTINASIPSPVVAEWSSNPSGNGNLYYAIQPADPSQGTFISHTTATGGPLSKWTPIASKHKQVTLGCTDPTNCSICKDGGSNPFLSAWVADANPPSSGACGLAPGIAADQTRAFGFHSSGDASNAAYLATVFYTDVVEKGPNYYNLWLACQANTPFPGKLSIGSQTLASGGTSAGLEFSEKPPFQVAYTNGWTLEDAISFIDTPTAVGSSHGWSCLSNEGGKTKLFWNMNELHTYASAFANSAYSDFSGNMCTSTGTPFGTNGVFTLTQSDAKVGNIFQNEADALCPLWSEKPAFNYYGQSGIPYPAGTQRYLSSGSISTGDPVSSLVQYRDNPTNCPTGFNTMKAKCGAGTFTFDVPVCTDNQVRTWSNT